MAREGVSTRSSAAEFVTIVENSQQAGPQLDDAARLLRFQVLKAEAEYKGIIEANERAQQLHNERRGRGSGAGAGDNSNDHDGESIPLVVTNTRSQFSTVPIQQLVLIHKNKFDPWNLYKLLNKDWSTATDDDRMVVTAGDKMEIRKARGTLKNYPDKDVWIESFVLYISILQAYFGDAHQSLVGSLLAFYRRILRLTHAYSWSRICEMAMSFHANAIVEGQTNVDSWVLTDIWIQEHCIHVPTSNKVQKTSSSPFSKEICQLWNTGACNYRNCKRLHICSAPGCKSIDHGSKDHLQTKP